ncbi:MAG: hypothetical protein Q8M70_02700 [bacterium]|nr:hypothetical protein [bacterium]
MLKTILEVSVILISFVIVGLVIYILYTRRINQVLKGVKKKRIGKTLEFRLLILSILCVFTIFGYVIVQYSIEQSKYSNFEVEISSSISELDFNYFYDELYQSSNADADILVGRDRVIHIIINNQGLIQELSLIVLIPRDGKLVEYAGVFDGNKVVFRTIPSIVNPSVFHFKLKEHTQRLARVDFSSVFSLYMDAESDQGLWIDINLGFIWEDIPVTHNFLVDSYSLDSSNTISLIDSITFSPLSPIINIWIGRTFIDNQNQLGSIHIKTYYLID